MIATFFKNVLATDFKVIQSPQVLEHNVNVWLYCNVNCSHWYEHSNLKRKNGSEEETGGKEEGGIESGMIVKDACRNAIELEAAHFLPVPLSA